MNDIDKTKTQLIAELNELRRHVDQLEKIEAERQETAATLTRYQLLSQHTREIILFVRPTDGQILEANDAAVRAYGYDRQDLLTKTLHALRAPETAPLIAQQMAQANTAGILFETLHRRKDGSLFPVEVSAVGATLGGERVLLSIVRDITARKRAEDALRLSEERFRLFMNHFPGLAYIKDSDCRILFANQGFSSTLNIAPTEIVGKTNHDIFPTDFAEKISVDDRQVLESGQSTTLEEDFDGRAWATFKFILPQSDQPPLLGGFTLDITERKQAERLIQQTERRYRRLFEDAPVMSVLTQNHDSIPYIFDCNQLFLQTLGYDRAEVIGRPLKDFYTLESRTQLEQGGYAQALADSFSTEERTLLTRDGRQIQALLQAVPDTDLSGAVSGTCAMYVDISERKQAEAALRDSATSYRGLFNSVADAIYIQDRDGRFLDVNDGALKMYGHPRKALIGQTPLMVSAPGRNDLPKVADMVQRAFAGEPQQFEFWGVRANGEVFPKDVRLYPGTYFGQQVVIALAQDITERKRAELALRESEQRLSQALKAAHAGAWEWNMHTGQAVWSAENYLVLGLARGHAEATYDAWLQCVHPDDRAQAERDLALAVEQRTDLNIEFRVVWPDGSQHWINDVGKILLGEAGQPIGMYGIQLDITQRKQAEARIQRLNRLYATLSQINQTIVRVHDQGTLFREICRIAIEFGEFRMAWIGLIDATDHRVLPVAVAGEEQGYLASVTFTYRDEELGHSSTGTAIREERCVICQDIATDPAKAPWREQALPRGYRSSAAVPIRQNARAIGALTVYADEPHGFDDEDRQLLDEIGQDISFALDGLERETRRQLAEAKLGRLNAELEQRVLERTDEVRRANERLHGILNTAGEGIVFTDRHGAIEYVNPAMERLTGYSVAEALGHNPRLWKSGQTPTATYQHLWDTLLRGEVWQGEMVNRRRDGTLYDAALTAAPLTDVNGQVVGFVGVQRDVSRQKEVNRLKDEFVSNVSHELRTPLTSILLQSELLEYGKPEKRDVYLNTLRREAQRLRKMIEDLLDLSRLDRARTSIQSVPTDLNLLLAQLVTDRIALAAQSSLTLDYDPAADLPPALADTVMLTQVVSNLMTNAVNYTPPGGKVTVTTALQTTEARSWCTFTVRDTGPGISATDLSRLFERFYRGEVGRKASAPGTGLGLAISKEIIERLGGHITVDSQPGQGAAFTVWLQPAPAI